jgi:hypothetical protein
MSPVESRKDIGPLAGGDPALYASLRLSHDSSHHQGE